MDQFFAVIIQRGPAWDESRSLSEQDDYPAHSAVSRELEASGFYAMSGLLKDSMEALSIVRAGSADEVRERFRRDPWQQDGHMRIARLEPIEIRIGAPSPRQG